MIKERDVIRIRIPFPDIDSTLAVRSHMYICQFESFPNYKFIKCQTLKPYMITENIINNYIDEQADISRNPFKHTSRIDCDKLFVSQSVDYNDKLKTTSRPDICEELFDLINLNLNNGEYIQINLNENELVTINPLITYIECSRGG